MRILHSSDNHVDFYAKKLGSIRYDKGVNAYHQERINLTRSIVEDGINRKVDIIIFAGDFHNKTKPPPQELADTYKIFDSIPSNIHVIIISGNHDEPTYRGSPLQPLLNRRENIHAFVSSGVININGLDFIAAPWNTPLSEMQAIRNTFPSSVKPVLIHHTGVIKEDLNWGEVAGEVGTIQVKQLQDLNCSAVLLGHYHGQLFFDTSIAYCGSPEYFRFDEEHQTKGYLIWTIANPLEVERVITRSTCFKNYDIEGFLNAKDIDPNTYIKVKGIGSEAERKEVLHKLQTIKTPGYKINIQDPIQYKRVITLETINTNTIFLDYLKNKDITPIDELVKLDQEIANEAS
jgi:DNA repair exonuclease SbcCD nuclease subunit